MASFFWIAFILIPFNFNTNQALKFSLRENFLNFSFTANRLTDCLIN